MRTSHQLFDKLTLQIAVQLAPLLGDGILRRLMIELVVKIKLLLFCILSDLHYLCPKIKIYGYGSNQF